MDKAKKIQCSSCGATSAFKVSPDEYKCNYCQTTFRIEENKDSEAYAKFHELKKKVHEQNMVNPAKAKRMGCIILVSVLVFVAGLIGTIVFKVKKQVGAGFNTIISGWQQPSINKYIAFSGSKGPVVWEILEQSGTRLDSSKHFLRIIDPVKNQLLSENPFGETTTWSDNFNFNKRLGYDFLLINDTLYNGSEEGGLQAFDLYTGKRILSNENFEKEFPELKDGIAKVESRVYNKEFVFYTNGGDEFHFFPKDNLLLDKKSESNSFKKDTAIRTNFYFTENKKSNLYLATKIESRNENGTISDYYIDRFKGSDRYVKRNFKKLQKLNETIYPCAQRLISNKDFVVFAYLSDFSKKADLIIEKLNSEGKTIWQNKDTAFKFFIKNFDSDRLSLDNYYSPKQIVFFESSGEHRSIGIDLQSGKTLFIHRQGYNID